MNKNIKITLGAIYLIILIIFLYFIFSKFDISRIGDFSYYKEIQINIEKIIGKNLTINLILFSVFSIIWIVLLGFGSPLLILSGILFGKWVGTIISTASISVGALSLYIIASYFFNDLVNQILKDRFEKYIERFQKNEFFYFFAFRFAGGLGIPFFLQNVLPVIFKMKNYNYFFASFLGFIPGFFIWNTIGAGINKFIKEADEFNFINLILSKEIYFPLIIFIILILGSLIIKKKFFND
ncbi:VTT domain-containing protein [Candidatus Pelagibacter bacterium]|nr:VTT domain-containing protein [Candidatus Pelagibacter bacterium]|tara:strand:- start:164 stop:880 length:717 start_codon:yes stop_codon:yes gene_type:complete